MKFKFDSKIKTIGTFGNFIPVSQIKEEPMFFNSSFEFAMENGGLITKSFLDNLPIEWKESDTVFDSRVHMLMRGWYPCIPGWHHDDVARGSNGQPDYKNMPYKSEHVMGLINGDICPTQFAIGDMEFEEVYDNNVVYEQWNRVMGFAINGNHLEVVECKSNELVCFDWQTWHQGQKAIKNGWRWFGRISRNTDRTKSITNEIRKQVQVYLEFPKKGW